MQSEQFFVFNAVLLYRDLRVLASSLSLAFFFLVSFDIFAGGNGASQVVASTSRACDTVFRSFLYNSKHLF
jgi:hypothetical protein